jgi:hypothetical protein
LVDFFSKQNRLFLVQEQMAIALSYERRCSH